MTKPYTSVLGARAAAAAPAAAAPCTVVLSSSASRCCGDGTADAGARCGDCGGWGSRGEPWLTPLPPVVPAAAIMTWPGRPEAGGATFTTRSLVHYFPVHGASTTTITSSFCTLSLPYSQPYSLVNLPWLVVVVFPRQSFFAPKNFGFYTQTTPRRRRL